MRHSSFTAFYDANVLYPAPLRDFLMHLALSGVYRARWSAQVHEEWKRNLLKNRQELTREQLDRTSSLMDKAVPDGLVTDYEPLIEGLQLPDVDDRHVLAAAIKCNASVIVTFNLKDFPKDILGPFNIEPLHPDNFIVDLWDLDQAAVLEAAQRQRASLKSPPHNAREYLVRPE
jgi:predicted nucleic acid-binding protein